MGYFTRIQAMVGLLPTDLVATPTGGLHVVQSQPADVEMTRLGNRWSVISTTAVAALIARPTTAALLTLWNGEAGGGPSYVINGLLCHQLVSGADARFGMWAVVHKVGMAALTNTGLAISGHSGKPNYGGKALVQINTTVVNDGWYPRGNSRDVETTGVLGGAQLEVPIKGKLIVPPTSGISVHVVATSVDEDFTVGFDWSEVQLDMK